MTLTVAILLAIWALSGVAAVALLVRAPFRPDLDPDLTESEIRAQLHPRTGEVVVSTQLPPIKNTRAPLATAPGSITKAGSR